MGRRHTSRVVRPVLGQVERAVNEGVPVLRYEGCEHADLAVRDLARRARVLPPDTAGRLALLEEAGLVDHQHRVLGRKMLDDVLAHDVAQRISIPAPTAKNGLLPPRTRIPRRLGPHPSRLAPLSPQQPVQEQTGRCRDTRLGEQGADARLGLAQ
jgi:hypothetical protein